MTEPYRDPDGPIHAVLAAANTVAPRCHLPDGVSLVHARYQYPACVPEATAPASEEAVAKEQNLDDEDGRPTVVEWRGVSRRRLHFDAAKVPMWGDTPWLIVELETDRKVGVVWAGSSAATVEVEDERYFAVKLRLGKGTSPVAYAEPEALAEAKRRTRRDVAGVIT